MLNHRRGHGYDTIGAPPSRKPGLDQAVFEKICLVFSEHLGGRVEPAETSEDIDCDIERHLLASSVQFVVRYILGPINLRGLPDVVVVEDSP